jgi:AcrR family transcriptional regulator
LPATPSQGEFGAAGVVPPMSGRSFCIVRSMQEHTGQDHSHRRRGRPRKNPAQPEHPGLPIENPLSTLSPTARCILETARQLLSERGFGALTIENIALEAGETKASVTHHFGSKAGLVETLFDSLVHDTYVALVGEIERLPPGEERIGIYIAGLRDMVEDVEAFRAFFAITPHALSDPFLRPRTAALYQWYRECHLQACGIELPDDEDARRRLLATAGLMLAAIDGLALQIALDPDGVDDEYALEVLTPAVQRALERDGLKGGRKPAQ